jgi:hypothetical protein
LYLGLRERAASGAKATIAQAGHAVGYQVRTEWFGPDWRADVLAVRDATRLAFEVQWTPSALTDTLERQGRYRRDGVRGCWFFRQPPAELAAARRELPLFELVPAPDGALLVSSRFLSDRSDTRIPLGDFVAALLRRRIRYGTTTVAAPQQRVRVTFAPFRCWRCGRRYHAYYVASPYLSRCGRELRAHGDERRAALPVIADAIRDFLASDAGRGLVVGRLVPYHDSLVGRTRRTFHCPHCASPLRLAVSGSRRPRQAQPDRETPPTTFETAITLPHAVTIKDPHWCYPPDGIFCDQWPLPRT